jgi:hypothetical protein
MPGEMITKLLYLLPSIIRYPINASRTPRMFCRQTEFPF